MYDTFVLVTNGISVTKYIINQGGKIMETESWIYALKNPKKRGELQFDHPAGKGFQELTIEEMTFISGGNGNMEPQATPTILTTLSPSTPAISAGGGISAVSGLISYTKKCL